MMPAAWLKRSQTAIGEKVRNPLSAIDQANEYLMMGLRITDGISRTRIETLARKPFDADALSSMIELELVEQRQDQIRATPRGRLLLNSVIAELLF